MERSLYCYTQCYTVYGWALLSLHSNTTRCAIWWWWRNVRVTVMTSTAFAATRPGRTSASVAAIRQDATAMSVSRSTTSSRSATASLAKVHSDDSVFDFGSWSTRTIFESLVLALAPWALSSLLSSVIVTVVHEPRSNVCVMQRATVLATPTRASTTTLLPATCRHWTLPESGPAEASVSTVSITLQVRDWPLWRHSVDVIGEHCRFNTQSRFIHWLIHWLIDSLIDWFIDWLIDWLIHSFIHSFIDSLIHWFIDWFIDWFIHSFIDSLIHWFIDSLIHWLIDWFIHSFIHSFIDWFVDSLIHWFIDWLIDSFIHSFIDSLIHSFIDSFIHWFIHSFIHLFIHS